MSVPAVRVLLFLARFFRSDAREVFWCFGLKLQACNSASPSAIMAQRVPPLLPSQRHSPTEETGLGRQGVSALGLPIPLPDVPSLLHRWAKYCFGNSENPRRRKNPVRRSSVVEVSTIAALLIRSRRIIVGRGRGRGPAASLSTGSRPPVSVAAVETDGIREGTRSCCCNRVLLGVRKYSAIRE